MRRYSRTGVALAVICTGLLGCGDDDAVAPVNADVSGLWAAYAQGTGQTAEHSWGFYYVDQAGGTFEGVNVSGTVQGASVALTRQFYAMGDYFTFQGIVSGDTGAGTFEEYGASVKIDEGSMRFERVSLVGGPFSLSGICEGVPVAVDTVEGFGTLCVVNGAPWRMAICFADGDNYVVLSIENAENVAPGTLTVVPNTPGSAEIVVGLDYETSTVGLANYERASSGTIEILDYTPLSISGNIDINFPGGGNLTGSFDVLWEIVEDRLLGSTYAVYGGSTQLVTVEEGLHPEDNGYTLLGSSTTFGTFAGPYDYYCIVADDSNLIELDALEDSNSNYIGAAAMAAWQAMTRDPQELIGAPDSVYSTAGYMGYGGWVLAQPPAPSTSITVYVAP